MARTTEDVRFGDHLFRIRRTDHGWEGIVVGAGEPAIHAASREELIAKLTESVLQKVSGFVGYDGARARFLTLFPDGFSDPAFAGDGKATGEILYKRSMAAWLLESLPLERALAGEADGATALRAFQRTVLVDRYQKAKLSDVLKGPRAAELVAILARFADGEVEASCEALVRGFGDDGVATWPVLTYLAFFWRPDRHCFLKPKFTKEYAQRVGHRFAVDYQSRPEPQTYAQLLDMLEQTRRHVADLGPVDHIDLHSFMWAVCEYPDPTG